MDEKNIMRRLIETTLGIILAHIPIFALDIIYPDLKFFDPLDRIYPVVAGFFFVCILLSIILILYNRILIMLYGK